MNDNNHGQSRAELQALLSGAAGGARMRWRIIVPALAVAAGVGSWLAFGAHHAPVRQYRTETVQRGTLNVKVSATGNLQPINQVDVGCEVSGTVIKVYVRENDRVKKGQILARLDPSRQQDAVTAAEAALAQAQAQVKQAEAVTGDARATLARLATAHQLSGGRLPATGELEQARHALEKAEAAEAAAKAGVRQSMATLQSEKTQLRKGMIVSPINGVVLKRSLEPGQTVAASLQAPVLFTLAEDLTAMELHVDVDEADVAKVRAGQAASFTVDAWPGRRFAGRVARVNLGSQKKNDVTSYQGILTVRNDDLSLRPGMTGTADIVTQVRSNVLLVPAAALRFVPEPAAGARKKGSLLTSLMPHPPVMPSRKNSAAQGEGSKVWLLQNGRPVPVEVRTGASNGKLTEVSGALSDGAQVIVDAVEGVKS